MPEPILFSTNPWIAHEFAVKYRGGTHFAWCSEHYDPATAGTASAAAAIAPSSSPKELFDQLKRDCDREDSHSYTIKSHRRTFRRLAADWLATAKINKLQYEEIIATVNATSWRIWRPQLYLIPRAPIEAAGRLIAVPRKERAAYGAELQIVDLQPHEFTIIEGSFP